MEVERDYIWKKYTFIPETKDDEKFLEVFNKYIDKLEEENRNLKNELMEDMKTESKLNEEIRNLKSELSKFRDSFKKYRDYEKEELADSCYDLARENEKLKEENKKLNERIE